MQRFTKAGYESKPNQREIENLNVAYQAACEGMVLLKNNGALPFDGKRVALYGAGAPMTIKGGTGSGEVNERHSVTILEGLRNRGFEIATEKWIADYQQGYKDALAAYKVEKRKRLNIFRLNSIMQMLFDNFRLPAGRPITRADVEESATDQCVYVLSRQAGEGGDRRFEKGDMLLTDEEMEHIRFCAEHYGRFVLVINSGSAVDMAFAEEIPGIDAILFICQPGTEGGHAFADVISGRVSPSGKLSDTWARRYSDIPFSDQYSYLDDDLKDEYYREGICVGYRYFDSFYVEPAYPFGFGLSYTDFEISFEGLAAEGTRVTVLASVKNIGEKHSGSEVVQIYVSCPSGTVAREYQSLAAFAKTGTLAPGEAQTVALTFDLRSLSAYMEIAAAYLLDAGEYVIRMGNSSRNTRPVGAVTLSKRVIVSIHHNICGDEGPIRGLDLPRWRYGNFLDLPRVEIDPDAIEMVEYRYENSRGPEDERVKAFVSGLSDAEMAEIVVGAGMFGGVRRFDLPGSVGNTTSKFWDRGLVNAPLCDGPAGLRLQKRSTIDKKGKIKPVDMAMSVFEAMPGFVKRLMTGDPQKDTVIYQYTTAFPVATALAQTWNVSLMEQVGIAVRREMAEYGCVFWLAPAVNIHRNPLCGRNFEYFSEDPLLSGKMAAAITRGVQGDGGYYVTVKHFACNNQEDNRNFMCSHVSERALREIYLRAFEIVVREGGAKAVMTSYNKLNGTYTANSHDLCTKVLRDEWGFDGVVMTDWFSTNINQGDNAGCIRAGNDMIMPGGARPKRMILKAVANGSLSRDELRISCERVVKALFDSALQKEYIGNDR